ncbi:MAG: penicillin-binding protein 2 [Silicimonas sp.]|nr:penicillin-binding protein 2 [Silicimonas sp.]
MTRTPLRPLARILAARRAGENPDKIERENLEARHEADRDAHRARAEGRLLVLGIAFLCAFSMVGFKMSILAGSDPVEPKSAASGAQIVAARADITDRNGRILATNLTTHSLYAQPHQMIDPDRAARELARIFPDLNDEKLFEQFTGKRKFLWIKRRISPEQQQAVFDIGDPGLLFGPREMRLYPNGRLAAHVLGGAGFGREGVSAAEVVGVAGVEKAMDEVLRDPGRGDRSLALSIDLTVQAAVEEVLAGGMRLMNAKGAAAVLMDAQTGEILSLASLPDFDPNDRPRPLTTGDQADSPLFNRAVQGLYELGSTFKIFTTAQGVEERLVSRNTWIETEGPMVWGKHKIRDFKDLGPALTVEDIIVESSNIGTARIALMFGAERQQDFLKKLGLFKPVPVELVEARGAKPLLPKKWADIHTMTVSYGHGISTSPLHLAQAYASLLNGGREVTASLIKGGHPLGAQVVSENTSKQMREFLRATVTRGTASMGDVPGYHVGGKTGTADKPTPRGGYYKDKVIATFASVFPAHDPKYVLVVTLDEPEDTTGPKPRRTAGWTAVPVAAQIIRRAAPLLGMAPDIEYQSAQGVTLAQN